MKIFNGRCSTWILSTDLQNFSASISYTFKFLLTSYVGLIWRSTAVATKSRSTIEGTMRLLCSYFICYGDLEVTWRIFFQSCFPDLVSCGLKLLTCSHKLLSCGHKILNCSHKLLSCGHKILTCSHKIAILWPQDTNLFPQDTNLFPQDSYLVATR